MKPETWSMKRLFIISLLAVCLLVPSLTEAHQVNEALAGWIAPGVISTGLIVTRCLGYGHYDNAPYPEILITAIHFTPPGIGHLVAGDFAGYRRCLILWGLGFLSMPVLMHASLAFPLIAHLYDAFGAPHAARAHNQKHIEEGASSYLRPDEAGIIPIFGHLFSEDYRGFLISAALWVGGFAFIPISFTLDSLMDPDTALTLGRIGCFSLLVAGLLYDIVAGYKAMVRYNKRIMQGETESSNLTIYPTLAFGKEYVGIGVGVGF